MPRFPLLLHEIFPSGDVVSFLMLMVVVISIVFAFIGVYIARRYGPGGLAVSTVAFCLLMFVLSTNSDRDLGALMTFPIIGGFAQAAVIGFRTRDGGGRSASLEALIGGGAFFAGVFAAIAVAAVVTIVRDA